MAEILCFHESSRYIGHPQPRLLVIDVRYHRVIVVSFGELTSLSFTDTASNVSVVRLSIDALLVYLYGLTTVAVDLVEFASVGVSVVLGALW